MYLRISAYLFVYAFPVVFLSITVSGINVTFTMHEEPPMGTILGDIIPAAKLPIPEGAQSNNLTYEIRSNVSNMFRIEGSSARLFTNAAIDRESLCKKQLTCFLSFQIVMHDSLNNTITVIIFVSDINDNRPTFSVPSLDIQLSEDIRIGTTIDLAEVMDADVSTNDVQSITMDSDSEVPFRLKSSREVNGAFKVSIEIAKLLDRESILLYHFKIIARDSLYTVELPATVQVTDVNDNPPIFVNELMTVSIPKDQPLSQTFFTAMALDLDSGMNARLNFLLSENNYPATLSDFSLPAHSGQLSLVKPFLPNSPCLVNITVAVRDQGIPSLQSQGTIMVYILPAKYPVIEVNFSTPTFRGGAVVPRNAPVGFLVGHLYSFVENKDNSLKFDLCSIRSDVLRLEYVHADIFEITVSRLMDQQHSEFDESSITCINMKRSSQIEFIFWTEEPNSANVFLLHVNLFIVLIVFTMYSCQ